MVLDFLPFDIIKTRDFFDDNDYDVISREETIDFLIDDRFCKYVHKSGKYKNCVCLKKIKLPKDEIKEQLCYIHRYQKEFITCAHGNCRRRVKKIGLFCYIHYTPEKKEESNIETINNDKNNNNILILPQNDYSTFPKNMKIYIYDNSSRDKCILFSKNRFNTLNKDIEKYLLFLKKKKIIIIKIKAFMYFNFIFKNINKKIIKNDVSTSTFTKITINNKHLLEFYLSSLKYVSETTSSIYLLRNNINNILTILKNKLSLDINEDYLELTDYYKSNYKTYMEEVIDEFYLQQNDNKNNIKYHDFLNIKYKYDIKKIKIKDMFFENTITIKDNIKLITYNKNKLNINIINKSIMNNNNNNIKKHNMKIMEKLEC